MYGEKDKRQIKSNNKLDQQHDLEFRRDSEHCAHAEMTPEQLEFLLGSDRSKKVSFHVPAVAGVR